MIAIFKTHDQADQHDLFVGAKIQDKGQKVNKNYRCERLSGVTDLEDGCACTAYHSEYSEQFKKKTGIDFEVKEEL